MFLATPLRSAAFVLLAMLTGWLLIALPARGAEPMPAAALPGIQYVAGRFPPYTLADNTEHATGPTAALIAALGKRIMRPGPVSVLPLARALAAAEHEPNTLIALIARIPEREARFHWVCPVLDYDAAMFRRSDRADVAATSLADLKRLRIAGLNRDVKTNYLERQGIPVQPTPDEGDALRLLLHGRVDAIAAHPATLRMRMRDFGEPADRVVAFLPLPELNLKLYLAFGKNTAPPVVETVSAACTEMTRNGEIARLMQPSPIN